VKGLTFGAGPHYCMGSHIGLIELEIVLRALLTQLPPFHSAYGLDRIRFRGRIFIREPIHFPVNFIGAG
jgi:cytochrome P450